MKTISALFVLAAAGTAFGQSTLAQDAIEVTAEQFTATVSNDAFSVRSDFSNRAVTAGDTASVNGGWLNGPDAFAFVSGQATGITTDFSGNPLPLGTGPSQIGNTLNSAGFTGTTTGGNPFAQISVFSTDGSPIDARSAAGFSGLIMGGGVEVFAGGTDDFINIDVPAGQFVNLLAVEWGFFDSAGTFLGAFNLGPAFGGNTVNVDSFGTGVSVGNLTSAGVTADVAEMFLFWEYEVIPTPGTMALLGLAGLAATRRRRA